MPGNIIVGTTADGEQRKVRVDDDGRLELGSDAPIEAVQLAVSLALLRQIAALRIGMIRADQCYPVELNELEDEELGVTSVIY